MVNQGCQTPDRQLVEKADTQMKLLGMYTSNKEANGNFMTKYISVGFLYNIR